MGVGASRLIFPLILMRKPVIGIDLGGTNMQVGIVRPGAKIVARANHKTLAAMGCEAVIERIVDAVREVCAVSGISIKRIGAVGLVAPGAVDIPRGVVLEAPNLNWQNIPLRSILRKRLNLPIVLDNDVNGAVWGEYKAGAGQGARDLLGIWLGTGVGGGLILNGALYHGPLFTAGEVGQTTIMPDGKEHARTVEDFCSRTGMSRIIQRRLRRHPKSILHGLTDAVTRTTSSKSLATAYRRKDDLAVDVVDRAAYLLGIAIANWVTVLALNRVIVGGGVTETLGEPFLRKVRRSFDDHVFPPASRECQIVKTELEADAGLLGAAFLAREGVV